MGYSEDDMLMLSGIQHYMFCPRQWALIHLEQQWDDNRLTIEGHILHENVDNPFYRMKNGGVVTLRSVPIASKSLGLYGITDAVELLPSQHGTIIKGCDERVVLYPVEYKHGKSKPDERDEVQLTAQAICLEEMYDTHIEQAALFYNETKHREVISIDDNLRDLTRHCAAQMHELFGKLITPKAVLLPHCKRCSLVDLCMPELSNKTKVKNYLKDNLYEETS
jgi:CRISPR-associated exonuclease Cas4